MLKVRGLLFDCSTVGGILGLLVRLLWPSLHRKDLRKRKLAVLHAGKLTGPKWWANSVVLFSD